MSLNIIALPIYASLLLFVVNSIYNRYFHPLRHIPGPFWGSITEGYKFYLLLAKHIPSFNYDLHQRYGPVVRVTPGMVSISDPSSIPTVYHRRADKSDFYTHGVLGERAPTVQILDHSEHAAKRKLIAPVLSMKNVLQQEDKVDQHILELKDALTGRLSSTMKGVEFTEWIRWFLLDTITDVIFNEPTGFIKQGRDVDGMIEGLRDMSLFALLLGTFPWLVNPIINRPFFRKWFIPRSSDKKGAGIMMSHNEKLVRSRLQASGEGDLLKVLLDIQSRNPDIMTMEDVSTECLMLMVAALDSTAGLICPLINNVIQDPLVYQRLMAEVEESEQFTAFTRPVATYDETCRMPYFMACIQETIRFSPSIPVILPRLAIKDGFYLHNIWIPEGTEIGANPYVINRDRAIFGEDAHLFRPERWLQGAEKVKLMERNIFTFGYGVRQCLGSRFAKLETQKLALQLFRSFRFDLGKSEGPWSVHHDRGFAIYEEQWLQLSERKATVGSVSR